MTDATWPGEHAAEWAAHYGGRALAVLPGTDSEKQQSAEGGTRQEEGRRAAMLDGEPVILRPLTLTVTAEEAEALDRGEMPESVLRRAAAQAIEDSAIMAMEEEL